MKIFGLNITKTAAYDKAIKAAEHKGLYGVVDLLKKKDKIYLSPVRLKGDGHTISNCVLFGQKGKSCIYISPKKEKSITS